MLTDAMHKSNLMNNKLHYMLGTPKAYSTCLWRINKVIMIKDITMDNQQETKDYIFN
jgi:hypothetical protein